MISGANFVSGATVSIGAVAATGVTVTGSTQITASTPSHAAGAADVTVTNPNGSSATLAGGFTYSGPSISAVQPNSGPTTGGTSVTITGSGFQPGVTVSFGGLAGTLTSQSASTLTVLTPVHASGAVDVTVTNPDGQFSTDPGAFTFGVMISSVSPPNGSIQGNTLVTIFGAQMQNVVAALFGGVLGNIVNVSASQVQVLSPAHIAGTVDVQVTTSNGDSATASAAFTYTTSLAVNSISPISGPSAGGTPVTIHGTNFATPVTVKIGGGQATNVVLVNSTTITAIAPAFVPTIDQPQIGPVDVTVTSAGKSATLLGAFTYVPPPTISSVLPNNGPPTGNTSVAISGGNFVGPASVFFGGVAATGVSVLDSAHITAVTPPHATATVDVRVVNADGQSFTASNAFAYTSGLALLSVSPSSGLTAGGYTAILLGTGFQAGAIVRFGGVGGVDATNIVMLDAAHMNVTVPAAASAGPVDVYVQTPDGQTFTLHNGFIYAVPMSATGPVNPTNGPAAGGTTVTINGTGFQPGMSVFFGGFPAPSVTVLNPSQLQAVTPAHAAGTVDINLRTLDNQSFTLPGAYTFNPGAPPTITSLTPNSGPFTGGTTVLVNGTNYQSGANVFFGGILGVVLSVTPTQIQVVTPAQPAAGAVDVQVVNPDTTSVTLAGGFAYQTSRTGNTAPTLTSVVPGAGPVGGGTTVVVTGTNFQVGMTATLGGQSLTLQGLSTTQFTFVTPAHAAGNVDLVVTNPDAQTATLSNAFLYQGLTVDFKNMTPLFGDINGGTVVRIPGTDFLAGIRVTFGGVPATSVTLIASTQLAVVAPAHAAGKVNVTVTNTNGDFVTGTLVFTYVPPPTVGPLSRQVGTVNGGTQLTITGTGFAPGTTVTFGGVLAAVTVLSPTQLLVVSPPAAFPGPVDVTVSIPSGGSFTVTQGFEYRPAATTVYVTHDFEDGALGNYLPEACDPSGGVCFLPFATTEAAFDGMFSAKTAIGSPSGFKSDLQFRWCYPNPPINSGNTPCNPPLADPNGLYVRELVMMPQFTIDDIVLGDLSLGKDQIKLFSNRFNADTGCRAPCQNWVTIGFGLNFGSQPLNQVCAIESSGVDPYSVAHWCTPVLLQGGVWYEFEMYFKRDPVTNTGVWEMWIDGQKVITSIALPGLGDSNPADAMYFFTGIGTIEQTVKNPAVVYIDDLTAANGFIEHP